MEKIDKLFLVLFLGMAVLGISALSNGETTQNTVSNVTVQQYIAISLSDNLTAGVLFGTVNPATLNNNATHNYDGSDENTSMWIAVSSDSNANVDLCIKDDAVLTSGGNTIPNTNYTYSANSTVNGANMVPENSVNITTVYTPFGTDNIAPSNNQSFRAWLDIPTSQASGDYVNNLNFKAIVTGGAC